METYEISEEGTLEIIPDMVQPPSDFKSIDELKMDLEMATIRRDESLSTLQEAVDIAQKRLDAVISFSPKK